MSSVEPLGVAGGRRKPKPFVRGFRWLLLAMLWAAGSGAIASPAPEVAELARQRMELLTFADRLAERDLPGLERFALLTQHAADIAVGHMKPAAVSRMGVRVFVDSLVDVFVSSEHATAKMLVMVSPPLVEGPPVHESKLGTGGFAPRYRVGEGRFRHFAMSSAAAYAFPPLWVELVGRQMGGDLFPEPGTDSAADVATNAAGRDFGLWLRTVEPETFADGKSVAQWIRARFGEAVP